MEAGFVFLDIRLEIALLSNGVGSLSMIDAYALLLLGCHYDARLGLVNEAVGTILVKERRAVEF